MRRTARSWVAYAWGPLAALVTAPLLARALGPDDRGALAAVLQPMTVADAVAAAGLPAAMAYFVARGFSTRDALARARWIYIPLGSVAAAVLTVWALILSMKGILPLSFTLAPWLLVVPFGAYIASRRGCWQGLQRYGPLDLERVLSPTIRLGLVILLCVVGVMTTGPFIIAYVIASLGAALALFKLFPSRNSTATTSMLKKSSVIYFSLKAAAGTIAIALNNRLDQAILPALISLTDLGYYSVAVVVAEVPSIFSAILARNLLAQAARGSDRESLTKTIRLGIVAVGASCLLIALLTPELLPRIFGKEFEPAVTPTIILVAGTGLASIGLGVTAFLSGRGRPGLGSIAHGIGAFVTISLYVAYGSRMTLSTACWIAVASQSVILLVSVSLLIVYRKEGTQRCELISEEPDRAHR